MLTLLSTSRPKGEILQKDEKTDRFKVMVIFLFTPFSITHEELEQSIPQSFTSTPKC